MRKKLCSHMVAKCTEATPPIPPPPPPPATTTTEQAGDILGNTNNSSSIAGVRTPTIFNMAKYSSRWIACSVLLKTPQRGPSINVMLSGEAMLLFFPPDNILPILIGVPRASPSSSPSLSLSSSSSSAAAAASF